MNKLYEIISLGQGHPFFQMIMSNFCSRFYCLFLTTECKLEQLSAKRHYMYAKEG